MNSKKFYLNIVLVILPFSLFAQSNYDNYINEYKNIAISEMEQFGIPASITLAQGILESGAGTAELAREANNHFGIKCHSSWTGERMYHDDDEKQECFRKYNNAAESFHDHSKFLSERERYKSLFELKKDDYKGWAKGLKAAGYATDPHYADRIIELIEKYDLSQYDHQTSSNIAVASTNSPKEVPTYSENNTSEYTSNLSNTKVAESSYESPSEYTPSQLSSETINAMRQHIIRRSSSPYVVAIKGDSYGMIADEFRITTDELFYFNDLPKGSKIHEGDFLYIRPKKKKASKNMPATHLLVEGESLHSVSQIYGIKLKSLMKLNSISEDNRPFIGKKLILR